MKFYKNKLPIYARFLLKLFLSYEDNYYLEGDLSEAYINRLNKNGNLRANYWLTTQLLKSIPQLVFENIIWSFSMLKNYLKIAYRNIIKNKVYSFINISGLALGLVCCLIIMLFINNEMSFDKHFKNYDNIYRVVHTTDNPDGKEFEAGTTFPFTKAFRNDFPEVEAVTQNYHKYEAQIQIDEKIFTQTDILFVDTVYTKIFDYEFILGNPNEALNNPSGAVLTEETALKLFGNESPMGKSFILNDELNLKVAGIIKNPPKNTNTVINMLISIEALTEDYVGFEFDKWNITSSANATFILANPNVVKGLYSKMENFKNKYLMESDKKRTNYYFQPLSEIHFNQDYYSFNYTTAKQTIWIFSVVGLLIIFIAGINFINLSIAQSIKRSKEVGMRKVMGANRKQLIRQFLGESFVYTLSSFLISLIITQAILPFINEFLGQNTQLSLFSESSIVIYLIVIFLLVNLTTGVYPSLVLSKFNPVDAFKNKIKSSSSRNSFSLRNNLVLVQFIISQILIISTIVVSSQIDYFKNKDLGFKKNNIISVGIPTPSEQNNKLLKTEWSKLSSVKNVAFGAGAPISTYNIDTRFSKTRNEEEERYPVLIKPVDKDYLELFGMKFLAGSNFRDQDENDTTFKYILNEKALSKLGIKNPHDAIGQHIYLSRYEGVIVGIVADFHVRSLHEEILPMIIVNQFKKFHSSALIEISGFNNKETIKQIEKIWKSQFTNFNFNHTYFDEYLVEIYETEERFFTIIKSFAGIAILISCLGLLGLVSFVAVQKTKEIGIRKVLGASNKNIVMILFNEFTKSIIASNIIAWPIAYYLMTNWLQDFAFRIDITLWMFLISGLASVVIMIVSVGYQSLKAAIANPVDSLKYE